MKDSDNRAANPEMDIVENGFIKNPSRQLKLKFLIPSILGIVLFLVPVFVEGDMNLVVGILAGYVIDFVKPFANTMTLVLVVISALASIIFSFGKLEFAEKHPLIKSLFVTKPLYVVFRCIAVGITVMVIRQQGLEFVYSDATGGTMLGLLSTLLSWLTVCAFLIPLLLDYGIMDFVGVLIRDFLQPLFRLPGRASLDLLASWIGNGTVGVLITTQQYEKGYYTEREAVQIATLFSAVSVPFCFSIAGVLNVSNYFVQMYLIMAATGIIAAVIMSHIWPFRGKYKDEYYSPVGKQVEEIVPKDMSKIKWGYNQALLRAKDAPGIKGLLASGAQGALNILFTLLPVVITIGTIGLIISEYTPVFDIISMPFRYVFGLMGIEEAATAAPAALVGFIDMYIPAVICANISSVGTRFFVCCLSLVQIIYISEVGVCILNSKLKVNVWDLFVIFIIKTALAIPVIWILMKIFMPF